MSDPLSISMQVSSAGLEAQTQRMRIISQNIANAGVTGTAPGDDPYTRKVITFTEVLDRESGISMVKVGNTSPDNTPFVEKYEPHHIAADERGVVKYSNVNTLTEMIDMRETIRFYEANLETAKQARNLITMTLDMMRA
ncbi:MAG: flagellar basal body rod protein FlgC [Pseudomonadota bacterium]